MPGTGRGKGSMCAHTCTHTCVHDVGTEPANAESSSGSREQLEDGVQRG